MRVCLFIGRRVKTVLLWDFANTTIWPLFHYFLEKVEYNQENWGLLQKGESKVLRGLRKLH